MYFNKNSNYQSYSNVLMISKYGNFFINYFKRYKLIVRLKMKSKKGKT